jgi:hypothetical protein
MAGKSTYIVKEKKNRRRRRRRKKEKKGRRWLKLEVESWSWRNEVEGK